MIKERCKEMIFGDFHHRQCSRNAWKDGYCKQHHPDSIKEQIRKSEKRWAAEAEIKRQNSPWTKLKEALKENERLKDEINRLNITIKGNEK